MVQLLKEFINNATGCNWNSFISGNNSEARQDTYRDKAIVEIEAQESRCNGFIAAELVPHSRPHDDFSIGAAPAVESHRQTVRAMEHDSHQAHQQKLQTTSTNHSSINSRHLQ